MATTSKSAKASSALSSKKSTGGAKKNAVDTSSKNHSSSDDMVRYSNTTYTPMSNKAASASSWSNDRGFSRTQQQEAEPDSRSGSGRSGGGQIASDMAKAPRERAPTVEHKRDVFSPTSPAASLGSYSPRSWLDENGWNPGAFVDAAGKGIGYFNSGQFFSDMAAGKGPSLGEMRDAAVGAVGNLPGMQQTAAGARNAIGALGAADTTLRNAEGNLFNYGLNSIPETNAMFNDPYGTFVNSMAGSQLSSGPMSMVTPEQKAAYTPYNPLSGGTLPRVATPIPSAQASLPKNSRLSLTMPPTTAVVKPPVTNTTLRPPPPNSTAYANGGVPSAFTPMTPAQAGTPPKTNTPMVTTTTPGTVMGPAPKPGTVAPVAKAATGPAPIAKSPEVKARYDEIYGLPKNLEGIIKVPTYDQYVKQENDKLAYRAARQALYEGRIRPMPENITRDPNFIESYDYANAVHQQDNPAFNGTIQDYANYVYNRPRSMDDGPWLIPEGEWPQGMTYEEAMYRWMQKWQNARLQQRAAARGNG